MSATTAASVTSDPHHRTSPDSIPSDDESIVDAVPAAVDEAVSKVGKVLRAGWAAKGLVYILMGLTAVALARHSGTGDEASPEGALGRLAGQPGGRVLLVIAGAGLLLYAGWRVLSAALVRGADASDWLHRAGYVFSALFYAAVGGSGIAAAVHGDRPRDSNAVERASSWALGIPTGRLVLLLSGAVVVVVGVYFVIDRGVRRSFREDLDLADAGSNERAAVLWTGTVGWVGRGIVTGMVGVFLARAAWTARHSEARGFDSALREAASSSVGSWLVGGAGVALVLYGVFCMAAIRHLEMDA